MTRRKKYKTIENLESNNTMFPVIFTIFSFVKRFARLHFDPKANSQKVLFFYVCMYIHELKKLHKKRSEQMGKRKRTNQSNLKS